MSKLLGDLAVRLSLRMQGWTEGFQRAAESVAETADEVEELASKGAAALGDMSDGFLTLSAAAAGAFILGAQGNKQMADVMKELEGVTRTLAVEFGKELIPLVKDLTELVKTGVAAWRNLSSEQRAFAVEVVKWSAILGTGLKVLERGIIFSKSFAEGTVAIAKTASAMAPHVRKGFDAVLRGASKSGDALAKLGKVDGAAIGAGIDRATATIARSLMALPNQLAAVGPAISSMVTSVTALAAPMWAAVAPILAVGAALGALVLVAAVLYDAWKHADTGLSEAFSGIASAVAGAAKSALEVLSGLFRSFVDFVKAVGAMMLESIAERVRAVAAFGIAVAERLGKTEWAKNLRGVLDLTGAGMVNLISKGLDDAATAFGEKMKAAGTVIAGVGKTVGAGAKDVASTSWTSVTRGLNSIGQDSGLFALIDGIEKRVGGLSGIAPTSAQVAAVKPTSTLEDVAKEAERALQFEKDMVALAEAAATDSRAEYVASVRAEAHSAAENFKELGRMADEARKEIEDSRRMLVDKLLGGLGDLGSMIQDVMQHLASGDVLGAVASLGLDILTRSEGFKVIMDMVNQVLQGVSDALGSFLTPMQPLVAAIGSVVQMVATAIAPVFTIFGEWLGLLAPVVMTVALLLQGMMPLFTMLTEVMRLFYAPVTMLLNVGLRSLFEVVKWLGAGILVIVRGLAWVWNGILGVAQSIILDFVNVVRHIPLIGSTLVDALNNVAADLGSKMISLGPLGDAVDAMVGLTWEEAQAKAAAAAEAYKSADAMKALNSELLNAPRLWKRNLAAANAQSGQASPYMGSNGGIVPAPSSRPAGAGPAASVAAGAPVPSAAQTVVNIQSYDPESTADAVGRVVRAQRFRNRNPGGILETQEA